MESRDVKSQEPKFHRLNYIGSKYKLLDFIDEFIKKSTGLNDYNEVKFADIFSGTGIVSRFFKDKNAIVFGNDSELYSSIIVYSMIKSSYNELVDLIIKSLNHGLDINEHQNFVGFITKNYSPFNKNERMFFTEDNAKRIDYLRDKIEQMKSHISEADYNFLIASLIVSADSVSNVPAVYGCYLKKFKEKANISMKLNPIHKSVNTKDLSVVYNYDVLGENFSSKIKEFKPHIVYLDPPYNERQYSKNYFPLNIIAMSPDEQNDEHLTGKTGIPESCFISDFCKKTTVKKAFITLFENLKASNTQYAFLSYSSESLISKEDMIELLSTYGIVSYIEKDYKRFKSFDYEQDSKDKLVKTQTLVHQENLKDFLIEYLFCIKFSI
jgi:adenine-specific DNA-methyltransferase